MTENMNEWLMRTLMEEEKNELGRFVFWFLVTTLIFFLCQLPFMSEEIIGTLVNPPGAQRPFVQSEEINHKCFGENGRRAHVFSIMHKLGMK